MESFSEQPLRFLHERWILNLNCPALGLLKRTNASKEGVERVGFQVGSIDEIKKRLHNAPPYLYPGEPEITVMTAPSDDPGKSLYLKDPDGNIVELSEQGWAA